MFVLASFCSQYLKYFVKLRLNLFIKSSTVYQLDHQFIILPKLQVLQVFSPKKDTQDFIQQSFL